MRSANRVGTAAAKRILPQKWIVWSRRRRVWLRKQGERIFGPASVYLVHDLENLPPVEIPEGCHATSVTPGTEMEFEKVVLRSFSGASYADWYRTIQDAPEYDPRNFLIIRKGEIPVAVVIAWQRTFEGEKVGQLHVLAVDPDFRGQGLAQAMMALCLIRSRERGFKRMVIVTEDHFIPAISLYLSCGAKPVYFNWFHKRRWRKILRKTRSRPRS